MFDENINGNDLYDCDSSYELDDDVRSGYTGPKEPIRKTCSICGKKNLIWRNYNGFWKLAECSISSPHICEKNPLHS